MAGKTWSLVGELPCLALLGLVWFGLAWFGLFGRLGVWLVSLFSLLCLGLGMKNHLRNSLQRYEQCDLRIDMELGLKTQTIGDEKMPLRS